MNRAEKRKKAKAEKIMAKKRRLARGGGSTRYAQKLEWRRNHIGGDPIPTWAPTWEQARPIVNAALEAANPKEQHPLTWEAARRKEMANA